MSFDYSDDVCSDCGTELVERCNGDSLFLKCYSCGREEKVGAD